jgi:hypothetical protein
MFPRKPCPLETALDLPESDWITVFSVLSKGPLEWWTVVPKPNRDLMTVSKKPLLRGVLTGIKKERKRLYLGGKGVLVFPEKDAANKHTSSRRRSTPTRAERTGRPGRPTCSGIGVHAVWHRRSTCSLHSNPASVAGCDVSDPFRQRVREGQKAPAKARRSAQSAITSAPTPTCIRNGSFASACPVIPNCLPGGSCKKAASFWPQNCGVVVGRGDWRDSASVQISSNYGKRVIPSRL